MSQPCPTFTPTLDEVLTLPIPTTRHVPGPCRQTFSETLGNLLASVAHHPSWEAMYGLLVLPKLVLQVGRRGGKAHLKQLAIDVGRRLTLFRRRGLSPTLGRGFTLLPAKGDDEDAWTGSGE